MIATNYSCEEKKAVTGRRSQRTRRTEPDGSGTGREYAGIETA